MKKILLIVDPQNDFITGSLSVESANSKMSDLTEYLKQDETDYERIFITMDYHPQNHSSFVENGGIWPAHCVQKTRGVEIYKPLKNVIDTKYRNKFAIAYKGLKTEKDEYSVFSLDEEDDITNTGGISLFEDIHKELTENDVELIEVCGIAGDFCVLNTIRDLMKLVPKEKIAVLEKYCASIDGGEKLSDLCYYNNLKREMV